MDNKLKRFISMILVLAMVVLCFSGCGKKGENKQDEALDTYFCSVNLDYLPEQKYEFGMCIEDSVDDELVDVSKDSFVLMKMYGNQETESEEIDDFTIELKDKKSLNVNFEDKTEYADDVYYMISSKSSVTKNNFQLAAVVYILSPQVDMDMTYTGAYRGSEGIKGAITLDNGWRFVDEVKNEYFQITSDIDSNVELTRVSDTEVDFNITDVETTTQIETIMATISKDIFASELASEVDIYFDYIIPYVSVDYSNVVKDENKLTIDNMKLSDDTSGIQDGLKSESDKVSIEEQQYDADSNCYSVVLTVPDDFDLDELELVATLKSERDEFSYKFKPCNEEKGINSSVVVDEQTVSVELTPFNMLFRDDIKEQDIVITGLESLSNVEISNISEDKIIITADYTDEVESGLAFDVTIDGEYDVSDYIPQYEAGTKLDDADVITQFAVLFAGEYGNKFTEKALDIGLPVFFELTGSTKDPQASNKEMLEKAAGELVGLENDISNLKYDVENAFNKLLLNQFQKLEKRMKTKGMSIISNDEVSDYVDNELMPAYDEKTNTMNDMEVLENEAFLSAVDRNNNGSGYILDVINYGDQLISTGAGTDGGIIDLYFSVIDSYYNFESQTVAAKKAFVEKALYIYIMNYSIAIQYCKARNNLNADKLSVQCKDVLSVFDKKMKEIKAMEDRMKEGKEKLLTTGSIVSKDMTVIKTKDILDLNWDFIGWLDYNKTMKLWNNTIRPSAEMYKNMMARAAKQGLSLADDLTKNGFNNVTSNKKGEYIYAASDLKYIYNNDEQLFFIPMKVFLGIESQGESNYYKADIVLQKNTDSAKVMKNKVVYEEKRFHEGNFLKDCHEAHVRLEYSSYADIIIAFTEG